MEQEISKEHRKKQLLLLQEKSLFASLLLVIIIVCCLVAAYIGSSRIAEKRATSQLEDSVNTVIDQISAKFEREGEVLRSAANILGASEGFGDDGTVNDRILKGTMEFVAPLLQSMRMRLLLPDDTIIMSDQTVIEDVGMDFDELARMGEHISQRMDSIRSGVPIVAHYVPVEKNGNTVAILYGVTVLSELSEVMKMGNIYNGNASVVIVDTNPVKVTDETTGETRDSYFLLMDTRNNKVDENGKLLDPDSFHLGEFDDFKFSKSRNGKTVEQTREAILGSETGEAVIRSESSGEWLYVYYAPAKSEAGDHWSIFVSIPESVAYENVRSIRIVFIVVALVLTVAIVIYFLFIRKSARETVRDSVERAVLEERLRKAEAAERAKTVFLSNMSHDIRTPMNAILGFTTLAETNIDNKERVQDYLQKILSSGNHLLSLINDILDMSRIESGKLNIEEKPCSISDIFRDMRNIIQTQMKSKQLNFFMDTLDVVDEDIYCDKLHLNQVLLNLLSNAIKFTPSGGSVSMTVAQKAGAPTGYGAYEIRVKDTGIGMSKEFAEHIFEPFERERTSTVSGIQGTGLGMAITKNIVDTMGGTITLETEQGHGTEFVLNLQFRLQTEVNRPVSIRELEGLRALVVDDSFSTCDSVSKMLMRIGMRAEWTLHGKEAVLRAQQAVDLGDEFSAYIIDWVMPDLGGFEIIRQIRKIVGDETPIIVVTAYDLTAIMDEAKELGVTAYCNKPIFLSELRETLVSAIEKTNTGAHFESEEEENPYQSLAGKRILLVEDNELNREIAEELLKENGFEVETAEDGTIAVEKVSKSQDGYYDLILMDVQMPLMNGYDATRAIRALENKALANIPIVAMTANAFDEDRKRAKESGMNAHVAKPIDVDKLMEVLLRVLENSKI